MSALDPLTRSGLERLARAPLLHFLLLGLLCFVLLSRYARAPSDGLDGAGDSRILVDRAALLEFVQSRTRTLDPDEAERAFVALDAAARQDWIDRFVREEALVREARALGLDRGDELIRRHLAQKLEFVTAGRLEGRRVVDAAALDEFQREHAEDYRVPATLSFTHVFVRDDAASAGDEGAARARAAALLDRLNGESISFRDALPLGDRFLYNRNYVDRTLDELRSHFGEAMADHLRRLEPDSARWTGPWRSDHGWHLVLLTRNAPSRLPALEEIEAEVRADILRAERSAALEAGVAEIVSRYRIELDPALGPSR